MGRLFQVIFKKQLNRKQWISLLLLTIGCMLKQLNFTEEDPLRPAVKKMGALDFNINALFILVQVICSCLAGVYNEYLLKEKGANVNIFVQNIFMYLDSIICNSFMLLFQDNVSEALSSENLSKLFHFKVLIIMINNSAIGIITSFFLKTLNSILKTFASALELLLTAVLSYLLFGIPIYINTVLAIFTVMIAIYLYSQSPVSNVPKNVGNDGDVAKEKLLAEEV